MKKYRIVMIEYTIDFVGSYLKEKDNWHCYKTDKGEIFYFRKEHMVLVQESKK